MSRPETLAWLEQFQREFGAMLRTPLDRSSGTLRAQTHGYAKALCDVVSDSALLRGPDRLAVYNRQYWFRLFTFLQREYLLTARLVGMWEFNELASLYLDATPPSHYDLQRLAPGFALFLRDRFAHETFARVPRAALIEASTLDAAVARVFLAPPHTPVKAAALAAAELPALQLRQAESVTLVSEHWPLLALRRRIQQEGGSTKLAMPAPLTDAQHWLIMRRGQGHLYAHLPPLAYRLYTLLAEVPVGEALARLEASCSEAERRELPGHVQGWLADGMKAGFWVAEP